MDLTKKTIKNLRKLLDKKEISARELCAAHLEHIKEMNSPLNALISVYEEKSLIAADDVIASGNQTVLTGIPCVITDNIMTEESETTCASAMLKGFIPPFDAAVVEKLRDAGSILLGKANMAEFSIGSSPVSGAAVSAEFAPYSLVSDTGGAVRFSASFNGLAGLRPSYGRVSRFGLAAFASSLDQIGPIAKTAEDCAIILNTIAGKDPRDTNTFNREEDFTAKINKGVKGLKITVPEAFLNNASDEVKNAVQSAVKEFEKSGAEILGIKTKMHEYAVQAYYIISSAEASSNLARYDGVNYGLRGEGRTYFEQLLDSRTRGFGDEVKRRIMFGNFVLSSGNYEKYYLKALALRQKIRAEYEEILKTSDIILTPTVSGNSCENAFLDDLFTVPSALAGLPSITTTCGYNTVGVPIGMLLTGNRFGEQTILQAADCFERLFNPAIFEM
ncbi:MAG: aspartyl/glutamyl-tRNA amidotransferase subunit A [Promicromonosporaceae bacterium]|nr:aspartyl/glutamyl-tRNA amidotransferase subunit A [Promicromonosporaceae bacterium]